MKTFCISLFFVFSCILTFSQPQETEATRILKAQNANLQREIVKLGDRVYAAVGFDVSNITMVVGEEGVIIIDTGLNPRLVQEVVEAFRTITLKPVSAIIFTHGHGDHTRGAKLFIGKNRNVQVWARENYGKETAFAKKAGLKNTQRPVAQGGFMLPPELRINNGVAIAVYPTPNGKPIPLPKPGTPNRGAMAFNAGVKPTHTFSEEKKYLDIAGIKIELYAAPGETDDQLFVWLPDDKVLCSGDNFYRSWPNLYAIRGTAYRDVQVWAKSIDKMIEKGAEYVVPGHTRVVIGEKNVKTILSNYRDAIQFVFDRTMEGIAKGMGPDQLVEYVKLPKHLAGLDYLREYYGRIDYSVRAIHNGYLGWFDGNPTSLVPLALKEEAIKMAQLAGGKRKLQKKALKALDVNEYQWASQLADFLIQLSPQEPKPKLIKARALTGLAMNTYNAISRNYYLTSAMRLRAAAEMNK